MVPHMLNPSPPLPATPTAPSSAFCSAAWLGSPQQTDLPSAPAAPAANTTLSPIAPEMTQRSIFISLPHVWWVNPPDDSGPLPGGAANLPAAGRFPTTGTI